MSKPLPTLYLVDASIAVTGAFVAARQAARALVGNARTVLVLPKGSRIAPEELQDFTRVRYLPMVTPSKNIGAMLRYLPVLFYGAWRLRMMMRRDRARRLILNDFYLMHGVLMRLMGFRGLIASWVRCDPARFAGPLTKPMLWLAKTSADHLVAVSCHTRTLLPLRYKVDILYDAYVGPQRPAIHWKPKDKKKLVYIANYIRGKGQDVAIAAFAIAAAHDASLKLYFYGGDMGLDKNRYYRAELKASVRQHGLQDRIQFNDFVADGFAVLAEAYAALNFSAAESFSMTVMEASGAGVPVIATASGGPQEIIVEGSTGYLIPIGDAAAAAERILALAADPAAAAAMGQAGAAHIAQVFSPQTFRTQLQSVLAFPN